MSSFNKGPEKVEVALSWDPSPAGEPDHDLDLIAATYSVSDPYGPPVYLVHFDSRSPDGTIILHRDSKTGQGFGADEVMTLELERLSTTYARVVVGVAIQQRGGCRTFRDIAGTGVRIREGYAELMADDFSGVPDALAATVAEFSRDETGEWLFRPAVRGFDTDPASFADEMGSARP